eukprot:gene11733-biopygen14938
MNSLLLDVVELLEEVERLLPLVLAEVAVEVAVEVVDLQSAPSAATPAILTQSVGRSTMTRHLLVESPPARTSPPHPLAKLWHRRLGHPGYTTFQRLVNDGLVKSLLVSMTQLKSLHKVPCNACCLSKAVSLPFPQVATREVVAPLQVLHLDIMGLFSVRGMHGKSHNIQMQNLQGSDDLPGAHGRSAAHDWHGCEQDRAGFLVMGLGKGHMVQSKQSLILSFGDGVPWLESKPLPTSRCLVMVLLPTDCVSMAGVAAEGADCRSTTSTATSTATSASTNGSSRSTSSRSSTTSSSREFMKLHGMVSLAKAQAKASS